jgi:tryptophan-rich sensory protein
MERGGGVRQQRYLAGMLRLALPVIATLAAAITGGVGSVRSSELYAQLDKPAWAPPASVFGPMWTVLYVLMAVAAVLVVRRAGWPGAKPAMVLFGIQLALNALWPWLFFASRQGAVSAVEIAGLLVVLVLTALAFARVHRVAAALLLPYLAWVGYATALTWSVWRRNPGLLG